MGKYNACYIVIVFSEVVKMLNKITIKRKKCCKVFILYIFFVWIIYFLIKYFVSYLYTYKKIFF